MIGSMLSRGLHSPVWLSWRPFLRLQSSRDVSRMRCYAKASKAQMDNTLDSDMEGKMKKQALADAMAGLNKRYGKGSIMLASEGVEQDMMTTGVLTLDIALGGGWPIGRIIEIYGPEASGKTALAMTAIRECQRRGQTGALIDAEHAHSLSLLSSMGLNLKDLLILKPETGEDAFEMLKTLIYSNAVDLIVVDSVSALTPKSEIEGDIGQATMGAQARLMNQGLRVVTGAAEKNKVTIIFINQLRSKIGVIFGNPEITSGGNALKYYASARIDLRRTKKIEGGIKIKAKVIKLKTAAPFQEAEFDFLSDGGVDTAGCVLDAAEKLQIVTRKGAWYYHGDEGLGQGRDKVIEMLKSNDAKLGELDRQTRAKFKEGKDSSGRAISQDALLQSDDVSEDSMEPQALQA